MRLQSQYAFSTKELAIAAAFKHVPLLVELEWVKGNCDGDVKYRFQTETGQYQIWIDAMPCDIVPNSLTEDETITDVPLWSNEKGFYFE